MKIRSFSILIQHLGARCAAIFVILVAFVVTLPAVAWSQSANTVVTAEVPSVTNLDASGCLTGTANVTDFGVVFPGSPAQATAQDCVIVWGSSNDTAKLFAYQTDGFGYGMWQTTRGALDSTFGTNGVVTTQVGTTQDSVKAATLQPDGKTVVVGYAGTGGTNHTTALARYNRDGTLDSTFGSSGGSETFNFHAGNEMASGVAIQPQTGDIIFTNEAAPVCIDALKPDGTIDTAFGTGGAVMPDFDISSDTGLANVAIAPDGSIYASGAEGSNSRVAHVTAQGAKIPSYGTNSVAIFDAGGNDAANDVAVLPSGDVVVAGTTGSGEMYAAELQPDGSLDPAWNGSGIHAVAVGTNDSGRSVLVQPDGKIVITGDADMGAGKEFAALRFNADGSLDTSFGGTGIVTVPFGSSGDGGRAVLQPDGKIAIGGTVDNTIGLLRLNSDGTLDPSLDDDGKLTIDATPGDDQASTILESADGALEIGGSSTDSSGPMEMVRLAGVPVDNYVNGTSDWSTGTNAFGACLHGPLAAGVTGAWTSDASCAATDGADWNTIATDTSGASALVAESTTAGNDGAIVDLRFGLRTATDQLAGTYLAPITFYVVAPDTT